jgi:hypothetical protein
VKSGRLVRVKVIAVDVDRQRIGLTPLNQTPFEARTLIVGHRTNPRGRWRKRCVMPVSDSDRCAYRLTSCLINAGPVPTTCGHPEQAAKQRRDGRCHGRPIYQGVGYDGDASPRGPRG